MDAEVKLPLYVIRVWGKRAILTRAWKEFECSSCGLPIEKGEDHYCVYITGGLRTQMKLASRVHVNGIHDYLNFGGGRCQ